MLRLVCPTAVATVCASLVSVNVMWDTLAWLVKLRSVTLSANIFPTSPQLLLTCTVWRYQTNYRQNVTLKLLVVSQHYQFFASDKQIPAVMLYISYISPFLWTRLLSAQITFIY